MRKVFIHIPKTAGTSVAEVLRRQCGAEKFCEHIFDSDIKNLSKAEIQKFHVFAGHFNYATVVAAMPHATCFTFLRSPLERVLSLVRYWRAHSWEWIEANPKHARHVQFAKSHTLAEIFCCSGNGVFRNINNVYVRVFGDPSHYSAQGQLLVAPDRALERAIKNAERLAFVGFVEHMDASMGQLLSLLQWDGVAEVPCRNTASDGYFRPERAAFETTEIASYVLSEEEQVAVGKHIDLDAQFYQHFLNLRRPAAIPSSNP